MILNDVEFLLECYELGIDQYTANNILKYYGRDYFIAYQDVMDLLHSETGFLEELDENHYNGN